MQSKISTFLYAVVKRKWLQELAYQKKYTSLEPVENNPGNLDTIDESFEERELADIVKNCIKLLSPLCQKILIAFYYDEFSMQEISIKFGLANEDVAKSKKYQCKKELERLVKKTL